MDPGKSGIQGMSTTVRRGARKGVRMKFEDDTIKRVTGLALVTLLLSIGLVGLCPVSAAEIPDYHHVWLDMTNGAFWSNLSSNNANQSYYFKFDGGGLNSAHITASPLQSYGQFNHGGTSGTFYITDTGGRGFNDDIILVVAAADPDINLGIDASGYRWQPTAVMNQVPAQANLVRVDHSVNQYFTSSNFSQYDPQSWRPCSSEYINFYNQAYDPTPYYLSFIDLKVGNLGINSTVTYADSLIDNGSVKVTYNVTDDVPVAFNAYAWCNQSNQGKGVSWTNALTTGGSGWDVNSPY